MYKPHDRPVDLLRQVAHAGAAPSPRPVADHGVPLAAIVAALGLAVTSGCAVAPAAAPAVASTCVVAVPPAPPPAPPPAKPAPVARVVRPQYVRPVIPPLPAEVYQASRARP
jgi:hypothetical protein